MSRQKVLESAGIEMKERAVGCLNSVKALCKYTNLASGGGKLTHGTSLPPLFLQGEGLEAESKVEISFKSQVSQSRRVHQGSPIGGESPALRTSISALGYCNCSCLDSRQKVLESAGVEMKERAVGC